MTDGSRRYRFGDRICQIDVQAQPHGASESSYSATLSDITEGSERFVAELVHGTRIGAIERALRAGAQNFGVEGEDVTDATRVVIIPLVCSACGETMEIECRHQPGFGYMQFNSIDCPYCGKLHHRELPGELLDIHKAGERER